MDLNYSAEDNAFRQEVRDWLASNLPANLQQKVLNHRELNRDEYLQWHKILAKKGWVAPAWPVEWGGTGWTPTQKHIYEEECGRAGTPQVMPFGISMVAPVIMKFGNEGQKRHFLPRIYHADDWWCQGYSEPGSGSDLASLKTRAVRQGDKYIVNGQKTWTTMGQHADWIFCLVRTDPEAKKQEGISFLLMDMRAKGITVRPIITMDGGHEVNEVFFDNVEVPVENLVGEENKGWTCAKYLLGHERTGIAAVGRSKRELAFLKKVASEQEVDGKPLTQDIRFAHKVADLEIEIMALEMTVLRVVSSEAAGKGPGPEASLLKVKGTEIQQRLTELMLEAVGPQGAPFRDDVLDDGAGSEIEPLAAYYFNFRKTSIYGGSNEIQKNIMTQMILGL
jgi:alkylation response protein AidB-like acyl-CoA dehydrogenase